MPLTPSFAPSHACLQPGDSDWRFWRMYELYHVHKFPPTNLYWPALPGQLAKVVPLLFVVAFGSSMDVAAIQAQAPFDLNYNSELVTVGLSNVVTGLVGVGFTGSYIFSQTLFSLRMGVDSPVMGAIVAGEGLGVGLWAPVMGAIMASVALQEKSAPARRQHSWQVSALQLAVRARHVYLFFERERLWLQRAATISCHQSLSHCRHRTASHPPASSAPVLDV